MPSKTWYLVEARLDPLFNRRFLVGPSNIPRDEVRTLDDAMRDAGARGFDCSYCSSFFGIEQQRSWEIRKAVTRRLSEEYDFNFREMEFDVLARMVEHA